MLRLVAGLEATTGGSLSIGGKDVTNVEPADRGVAMVFQSYALYPHMTVAENRVFRKTKNKAGNARVDFAQPLCRSRMDHRPAANCTGEISGGMKQRVGIARCLAMQPKVLLMDEPFGALDALTRAHLLTHSLPVPVAMGNTVIMITHDVDEAVFGIGSNRHDDQRSRRHHWRNTRRQVAPPTQQAGPG